MKSIIVMASVHHENTKKIVEAIAKECNVEVVDATKVKEMELSGYDCIGFASGIYYGKFHQTVLNFASVNLPANKKVFYICTYGGSAAYKSNIGYFGCKGYDTYGPFKLLGGIAKGHPDEKDIADAVAFYKKLEEKI